MEDFELAIVHYVAAGAFVLAGVFGFVANKTNFCTMGAVSDMLHMGSLGRLGAWLFAMGLAILGTQGLHAAGLVDLDGAIYLTPNFGWLGYVVGGIAFGAGMTLAGGCGQRNLVRFGAGNLKALVVLLVLGITAYTTVRGLLGLARITIFEAPNVDLEMHDLDDQGLATLLAAALGMDDPGTLRTVLAALLGGGLVAFALAQSEFRRSADNLLAGIVIGAVITGGWFVTGYIGNDDFEPVPLESMTFVAPTGNAINYLMTFTGSTINFGVGAVLGMIAGSFPLRGALRKLPHRDLRHALGDVAPPCRRPADGIRRRAGPRLHHRAGGHGHVDAGRGLAARGGRHRLRQRDHHEGPVPHARRARLRRRRSEPV